MNDIELIPLGKLRLSEANVRKNDSNLFIEELAANIEAKGLLQNLIVVPAKKRGMFDVTAGGRRLRALNYLLEAGKLPKDHPVACRVLDIDAAEQSELSLIENVIRLDMTPTDEIRAYTLCAEHGLPNELHDSHASYIHHWMKILRGDKTAILHAAAKAEQAVKWLRQFDPALGSNLPDELKEAA